MKFLQILVLIFGLTVFANSQTVNKSILSGTIYDADGSVIVKAKVTAINHKGEKIETVTNDEGVYILNLTFNRYDSLAKYDIIVEMAGFKKSFIRDFVFIPSQFGKTQLDIALEAPISEPCGYGGDLCLEFQIVENTKQEVQNTALQKPLEKLPMEQNKSRFCGTIIDEQGAVIPNVIVEGKSSKGNSFKINTDSNGSFDTEIFDGLYKILIKADSFKKVVMKNKLLPFEPRMCIQVELNSNVPPHQIT